MKKIVLIFVVLFSLNSCKTEKFEDIAKDSVKISGLIAHKNKKENAVEIIGRGNKEIILVNPDGTFSKTYKLKNKGFYTLYDGKNKIILYLKGGENIHILYDYKDPNKLLEFKGKGAETNKFIAAKNRFERENDFYNAKKLYALKEEDFKKKITEYKNKITELLADKKIDSTLTKRYTKEYDRIISNMKIGYKQNHITQQAISKGAVSPEFTFENYKGGKTSLKDLKGNYVYIDVWATWCGPCKKQIPYLKKLEEEFRGKPIKFVSISVDDARRNGGSWEKAKEKWRNFVKSNKLGGIQLIADKGWQSDFIKKYGIRGIPRFILLDKEGKIINPNAPRPAQESTKNLLQTLK